MNRSLPRQNLLLKPRRRRAFTLIELLCVMSLMTVLVSMTLPMLSGEKSISSASSQMADVLACARATALSKNLYVYVGFAEVDQSTIVYMASSLSGEADLSSLVPLGRPLVLSNIDLCDPSEIAGRVTFTGTASSSDTVSDSDLGGFSVPYRGSALQCSKVIQFAPSGAVSIKASGASRYIQLGLAPIHPAQSKNVSLIQIAGLTGGVSIFMP